MQVPALQPVEQGHAWLGRAFLQVFTYIPASGKATREHSPPESLAASRLGSLLLSRTENCSMKRSPQLLGTQRAKRFLNFQKNKETENRPRRYGENIWKTILLFQKFWQFFFLRNHFTILQTAITKRMKQRGNKPAILFTERAFKNKGKLLGKKK